MMQWMNVEFSLEEQFRLKRDADMVRNADPKEIAEAYVQLYKLYCTKEKLLTNAVTRIMELELQTMK